MSPDRRRTRYDNPVTSLLRSGVRGILAVTMAVVIVGVATAFIALVVAATF